MGSATAVAATVAISALLYPLRGHLDIEATSLLLIVPVIVGVEFGGFAAGVPAMAVGIVSFDYVFLRPNFAVSLNNKGDWIALLAYVVTMTVTIRVAVRMNAARSQARRSESEVRRLFDVSELLVRESAKEELLVTIVTAVQQAFELDGAALLLPVDGRLEVVASVGQELSEAERLQLSSEQVNPITIPNGSAPGNRMQAVALVASGLPIGLLAVRGLDQAASQRDLIRPFANHLALALERAELRESAVKAQLLEEMDGIRRSLVGAVSHDLRTPLTAIKISTSALLDPDAEVDGAAGTELIRIIDVQADRLDQMVSSVLDMTRIESGALELRCDPVEVSCLLDEAMAVLGPLAELDRVRWASGADLPAVSVDRVLVRQVLANLLDNALRYAPPGTPVTVSARPTAHSTVEVAVSDRGSGVPVDERSSVFQMFNRAASGGRGGLGLAIARAFVEAHGQRIWIEDAVGGGGRFCFTLPVADLVGAA